MDHYGIRGVANDWFRSYLTNRKQFVSVSGCQSDITNVDYGVPQGSVLGPLLFLIYINDLHKAIKYSSTRHFADDTNILIKNSSLKQLKKHLNLDLRSLCNWLKANKISLNCSKTELLIFRHPNKQIKVPPHKLPRHCSSLFVIVPKCSSLFDIVPKCSSLFDIVLQCSTLFDIVPQSSPSALCRGNSY